MKRYITFLFIGSLLLLMFIAQASAQTYWTKNPANPVLNEGSAGKWDDYGVSWPFVIYDGAQFVMWYAGNPDMGYGNGQIGRATSPDGINWTKDEGNPVLPLGSDGEWDDNRIDPGPVIFDESGYRMWYYGYDGSIGRVGLATSPDGITWTKYDDLTTTDPPFAESDPVVNPGVPGTWDDEGVAAGTVLFKESVYKMWYAGNDGFHYRVGYATSTDGIDWTKYEENHVLDVGSTGSWDANDIQHAYIIINSDIYQMWYQGKDDDYNRTGYATSPDGIDWTKYEENPVLDLGSSGSWDTKSAKVGSVILQDNVYRMWYMAKAVGEQIEKIGYATAPVTINVPDQVETIQAAIDSAVDGNLVLVDEGTYYENINFKGKAITVASHYFMDGDTSHKSNTIIDGSQPEDSDTASVVYFGSGEDSNSVLCGFTITGGTGTINTYNEYTSNDGGGISIYYSGAKIINNIVKKNVLQRPSIDNFGAGISAVGGSKDHIIIRDNVFTDNKIRVESLSGSGWGAGAGLGTEGTLLFEKNIVDHNIIEAASYSVGGGISMDGNFGLDGHTIINSNIISNNEAKHTMNVSDMSQRGGGVSVNYANVIMTNNIISNNISEGYGGGVHINSYSDMGKISRTRVINNTIVQNKADIDGGIYIRGSYVYPVIINSIVWNNSSDRGNQISGYSGHLDVVYSDIQDGWTGDGNIDHDPQFADDIDFKLSDSSPCIGAGINSIEISGTWYYSPDRCYYDFPRPLPAGTDPDIGACEHPLGEPVSIEEEEYSRPLTFKLNQNFPNPFNPITMINYQLPKTSDVELSIYNLLGQKMVTLVSERQQAGSYQVEWDAGQMASGVYYYKINAGEFVDVKKMILIR